jgi:hypothetical protein
VSSGDEGAAPHADASATRGRILAIAGGTSAKATEGGREEPTFGAATPQALSELGLDPEIVSEFVIEGTELLAEADVRSDERARSLPAGVMEETMSTGIG